MTGDYQEMIKLWLSLDTNHGMSVVFVQHISWLMVHRCRAQRQLMAMEEVRTDERLRPRDQGLGD